MFRHGATGRSTGALAVALVASALAAGALVGCGESDDDESADAAAEVAARISIPDANRLETLGAVTVGGGTIWAVPEYDDPSSVSADAYILRVDPEAAALDGEPSEVSQGRYIEPVYAGDSLWLPDGIDPFVIRVQSPADGEPSEERIDLGVGNEPRGTAADEQFLWVTTYFGLSQIELSSNEVTKVKGTDAPFDDFGRVATGDGFVWLTDFGGNAVIRLDPETGETETATLKFTPIRIAFDGEALWAISTANAPRGVVARIDAETMEVGEPIKLGGIPFALAAGEEGVWASVAKVTNYVAPEYPQGPLDGTDSPEGRTSVLEIDPESEEVGARVTVRDEPAETAIAVGEGSVWVTVERSENYDPEIVKVDP